MMRALVSVRGQPLLDPFGVRWYKIKRIVGYWVLGHVARVLCSVGGLGCVLDQWLHEDMLMENFNDMLKAYHAQGGTAM
jgi:hypothetical protein